MAVELPYVVLNNNLQDSLVLFFPSSIHAHVKSTTVD